MASLLSDILTPGWSTSTPGDMKNPSGLKQFGQASAAAAAAAASSASAMASLSAAIADVGPHTIKVDSNGTITGFGLHFNSASAPKQADPDADKPKTSEDAW